VHALVKGAQQASTRGQPQHFQPARSYPVDLAPAQLIAIMQADTRVAAAAAAAVTSHMAHRTAHNARLYKNMWCLHSATVLCAVCVFSSVMTSLLMLFR
jgi:hypothetical protein